MQPEKTPRVKSSLIGRCHSALRHYGRTRHIPPERSGFTLPELLLLIGVIGILLALAFPAINRVSSSMQRIKCGSNLKQVALANLAYAQDNQGRIAAGSVNPVYWWMVIRPYLGGAVDDANHLIAPLLCPSDTNRGIKEGSGHPNIMRRSYGLNRNLQAKDDGGTFIGTKGMRLNALKNPSRVVYAGDHEWWRTSTNFLNANQATLNSIPQLWHDGWCNLVFIDGHVELLRIDSLYPGQSNGAIFEVNPSPSP